MKRTEQLQKVVDKANEMILNSPTKSARESIANIVNSLLHASGSYKGFNYVDWYEGGFEAWMKAGNPEDKTPYLGDQSKIFFY